MFKKAFITLVGVFAFSSLAHGQASECPIGTEKGGLAPTPANVARALGKRTQWEMDGRRIKFVQNGVFKLKYNGQHKKAKRKVNITSPKATQITVGSGSTARKVWAFKGNLAVERIGKPDPTAPVPTKSQLAVTDLSNPAWMKIKMKAIWFDLDDSGRCVFMTKTEPAFYNADAKKYPYRDERHHTGVANANVARYYEWTRVR